MITPTPSPVDPPQARPKPDVIIVGAGPIGLAHAWGLKKLNPNLRIVVYEKYAEYQRKHTLRMEYKQLHRLMVATDSLEDPILVALLARLKSSPYIRTSELEECFKQLCTDNGVEIEIKKVKRKHIRRQFHKPGYAPALLLGADGTHSIVRKVTFPNSNTIKTPFGAALQFRYEVTGRERASDIGTIAFFQQRSRAGLIATEHVGSFDSIKRTTPVTMQMVISDEEFEKLKTAKSNNPIYPYKGLNIGRPVLPTRINDFIGKYFQKKLEDAHSQGNTIDQETARISVNETPASRVIQSSALDKGVYTVLRGDAELGLSFFKGLNAGIEATAIFLEDLRIPIEQGLTDQLAISAALDRYQQWFDKFAQRKIAEVAAFRTWNINLFWNLVTWTRSMKESSQASDPHDPTPEVIDKLLLQQVATEYANRPTYPHRPYPLVELGQWAPVSPRYTLSRIIKLFNDYFKPYKTQRQLIQDFKQPLVGLSNFLEGALKIMAGIITLRASRVWEGLLILIRGTLGLLTTPLAWTIKPLLRGTITHFSNPIKIEENPGLRSVITKGTRLLSKEQEEDLPKGVFAYDVLAVCNDLHRKFIKSIGRGQSTDIIPTDELEIYESLRSEVLQHSNTMPQPLTETEATEENMDVSNGLLTKAKTYLQLFETPGTPKESTSPLIHPRASASPIPTISLSPGLN